MFWNLESIGVKQNKNEHLTSDEDVAVDLMGKNFLSERRKNLVHFTTDKR
jgi:hypothetical protein